MIARLAIPRGAALLALATTACELVAGLTGSRETQVLAPAPGCAGFGGQSSGCTEEVGGGGTAGGGRVGGWGGDTAELPSAGDAGAQAGEAGTGAMSGAAGANPSCDSSDAPPLEPPSCAQLERCNEESACTTLCVPGGAFLMGRGNQTDFYPGGANEQPEHGVTLSPYWLDKYEVTVGRFRRFVESYDGQKPPRGAGANPRVPASGWKSEWDDYLPADRQALEAKLVLYDTKCNPIYSTWTPAAGNSECLPINCIDWYLAFAFCVWDGGRLPSEAEWEFAAAGGPRNRLFPWGSAAPDNQRAVYACSASGSAECSSADIRTVGSTASGNGVWGHADLAGSLIERTRDIFDREFYSSVNASGADVINLSFDATEESGTIRGGGYLSPAADMRAAFRNSALRSSRWDGVGWRCARNF